MLDFTPGCRGASQVPQSCSSIMPHQACSSFLTLRREDGNFFGHNKLMYNLCWIWVVWSQHDLSNPLHLCSDCFKAQRADHSISLPFACGRIVACGSDSFISGVRIRERRFGRHQHFVNPSSVRIIASFVVVVFLTYENHYTHPAQIPLMQQHKATDIRLIFTSIVSKVTWRSFSSLFKRRLSGCATDRQVFKKYKMFS